MQIGELEQTVAFDTVRREIAERIRRVCEHFDQTEFEALVDRMATIEVRYRMRDDWTLTPRMPDDDGIQ